METIGLVQQSELSGSGIPRYKINNQWFSDMRGQGDILKAGEEVKVVWEDSKDHKYRNISQVLEQKPADQVKVDQRETLIIRQTCIKAAVECAKSADDIIFLAEVFEKWILRSSAV